MNQFLNTNRRKIEKDIYPFKALGEVADDFYKDEDMPLVERSIYDEKIRYVRDADGFNFAMPWPPVQRAKQDISHFMDDKCGLINANHRCRCCKKSKRIMKNEKGVPGMNPFLLYKLAADRLFGHRWRSDGGDNFGQTF